jgi:hypothetical protein
VDPADPGTPVDPANPGTPVDPANPVDPVDPVDPADPGAPVDPANPGTPVDNNPNNPGDPENTANIVTADNPVDPSGDPVNRPVADTPGTLAFTGLGLLGLLLMAIALLGSGGLLSRWGRDTHGEDPDSRPTL